LLLMSDESGKALRGAGKAENCRRVIDQVGERTEGGPVLYQMVWWGGGGCLGVVLGGGVGWKNRNKSPELLRNLQKAKYPFDVA